MNALMAWLDNRTGYKSLMHEALYERVPGGARWRYVWGSTLVFTFVLQVITGFMLWSAYSPSTRTAWESVYYIQNEMTLGYLIRGVHHFAAQAMVVLMAIHLVQVIIDGAYKAPREINFWLGMVLMMIVLGLSLTGYLLPWDQKGYYATQVTTNIMSLTPVAGAEVQTLAQGGNQYGHMTLTRFFAMHAGILPALLVAFLALHIYCFRRHGLTVHDENHAPETSFWPDQVLKDAIACLAVLAVVLLFAIFKGAELSAPADAAVKFDAARPEWYFLFLFRFLRFHAVESIGLVWGAIVLPGVIMGVIALMPLTHKFLGEFGHTLNKAFIWLLGAAIVVLTAMAFIEDRNDIDHQAALAEAHRDGGRAVELASGPDRIPVDGAVGMLRRDPFTQGPRLFAKHCSSCHRYNGHDGRGMLVTEKKKVAPPTASDLGNFGSREWMRSIVVDYAAHLSPLKNAGWFKDAKAKEEAGEDVTYLNPDESEMADWSGYPESLLSDENSENLDALVEFLYSEANPGYIPADVKEREEWVNALAANEQLAAKGRAVATEGAWAGDLEGTSCADCHTTIGEDFVAVSDDDADGYPTMAKYGSAKWLTDFIRNPGAPRHYGAKNEMPAYPPQQLTDEDLNLLVRWLTHDYLPSDVPDYPSRLGDLPSAGDAAADSNEADEDATEGQDLEENAGEEATEQE
ncbi:cytochrome b N-terminal domain-containing protein [Fuerstiella marisgermanici]|uniref:Menaquinol-cytochrome c reductase cytochrome b subunit n=1 Tax=Fuerstiella marisgermanici TaxID=1891926 RepID=A0A1P8WD94_9PLAN|nr:cytochrome b N-terminal domain-containing protein [Fuerstiella marisgermanici]APZ92045.1 Menaquinol-cytochrome c reductase cytochrome b subunit [Fuerstiella marisgermanici]